MSEEMESVEDFRLRARGRYRQFIKSLADGRPKIY